MGSYEMLLPQVSCKTGFSSNEAKLSVYLVTTSIDRFKISPNIIVFLLLLV